MPDRVHATSNAPDRRTGGRAALVAVVLLSTLVTIWWSWPGIRRWDTTVAYSTVAGTMGTMQRADFFLNAWTVSWVSHALATDPASLFDGNAFHPARYSVAYSESMIGYVPLFAPVYWATGNPILALNVMAALTYPLAAVAAFLLARLWLGPIAAALVGMFYAFTLGRYVTAPHYQCLGIAGFPLIVLAIEQWLRRARTRSAALLVLAIVWQSMCSAYFLFAVLVLLLAWLPASLWHHRARLDRRRLVGLGVAGGVAAGIVVALMAPYLLLRAQGLMATYDDDHETIGLVPAFARQRLVAELFVYGPSPVAWLLAAVGLLLPARGELRWAKRGALLLIVVGCVAGLGPRMALGTGTPLWSPYLLLRDWVPGFATVRNPNRFAILAVLGSTLLTGIGFQRIARTAALRTQVALATAAVLLALALLRFPELTTYPMPMGKHPPPAYAWLRANGDGRALIEVPAAVDAAEHSRRTFLSTTHWHPVVEGYAVNGPKHIGMINWLARALPMDGALQQIVDLVDVGWLVVHRDEMDERTRAVWDRPLPDGLDRVAAFGPDVIYRVTRAPRDDRRARLVNADVTLAGTPIAPVPRPCSATLRFLGWNAPPTAGKPVRVDLEIVNTSAAAWPAAGFLPAGLVAAQASLVDIGRKKVQQQFRLRLDQDLPSHVPTRVKLWLPWTPRSGSYLLRIGLVQPSSGPLDDCVAPLEVPLEVAASEPPARTSPAGGSARPAGT